MPETQTGATPATPSATPGPNDQAAPAATGSPPPATPPTPPVDPPEPPATDDSELGEGGKAALEAERKARRDAEKRAKDAEKKAADLESEKLTEDQRKAKRLEELEAEKTAWERERQQYRIEQAVGRLTAKLKLVDVETVVRLVDSGRVEFDDSGIPTNVEKLVGDLVKEKPFLATTAATPPPAGGINAGDGTSGGPPPNLTADELEAAKASGMTPERYAAMKSVKTLDDWKAMQPPKAG